MKSRFVAAVAVSFLLTSAAFAQASRTWVSGVGDDVNPCSRTAPCKTWAGAISKTANGGEIDALDPAGFGSVTITKSITLDGTGTMASILNAGTFGININANSTAKVIIRGLSLNGIGTGTNAIQIIGAGAGTVVIQDCFIQNSNVGVSVTNTSSAVRLVVENTTIAGALVNGMLLAPTSTGSVNASVTNSHIVGTGSTSAHDGILQKASASLNLRDSEVSLSGGIGLHINGAGALATVRNTSFLRSGLDGVLLDVAGSVLRTDSSMSMQNNLGGFRALAGSIFSWGNNRSSDNGMADTSAGSMPSY